MKPSDNEPSIDEEMTEKTEQPTEAPLTEEEFAAQYRQLPVWQHILLVLLFLFGLAAVILVIDYAVEFVTILLKHLLL